MMILPPSGFIEQSPEPRHPGPPLRDPHRRPREQPHHPVQKAIASPREHPFVSPPLKPGPVNRPHRIGIAPDIAPEGRKRRKVMPPGTKRQHFPQPCFIQYMGDMPRPLPFMRRQHRTMPEAVPVRLPHGIEPRMKPRLRSLGPHHPDLRRKMHLQRPSA
jgi:hypothetical protein